MLWFSVLVGWPYVIGVLWGLLVLSPWSSMLGVPGMSFVWVTWAQHCDWVLISVGLFVGRINPRAGWLWFSTLTTVYKLLCSSDHMEQNSPPQGLVLAEISILMCCLWRLLDPGLLSSEVGNCMCLFLASWEGLWYRSTLHAAWEWSWVTCWEQCQYGLFCKSLVIRLLFSYSSIGYSGWLSYNLIVISVWSW